MYKTYAVPVCNRAMYALPNCGHSDSYSIYCTEYNTQTLHSIDVFYTMYVVYNQRCICYILYCIQLTLYLSFYSIQSTMSMEVLFYEAYTF